MITHEDADAFAEKLMGATSRVCRDYAIGDVLHEEPFSDQLCGRLKETLEDYETQNIRWQADVATAAKGHARLSARTLTKTKEEPEFGADIVMTLDIDTPTYSVRKGFLAQAKRLEPGKRMAPDEHRRLIGQCRRMLKLTPASMVFLYGRSGMRVIPATAVVAAGHADLDKIATYPSIWLYKDFAICWYGDSRLQATDPVSLEGLRMLVGAEAAVRFVGTPRAREEMRRD